VEINKPEKSIRRWAATATLLAAALIMLVPYVSARYAERVPGIAADLIDEPQVEVDNLFIYLMNQSMPVGTIYMTTKIPYAMIADVPGGEDPDNSMEAHFGGAWAAWGKGRVPVGVNDNPALYTGVIAEANVDVPGGGLANINTEKTANPFSVSLSVTGNILLTQGGPMTYSDNGVTINGGAAPSGSQSFTSKFQMKSDYLPTHNHSATMWVSNTQYKNGTDKVCGGKHLLAVTDSSANTTSPASDTGIADNASYLVKPGGWDITLHNAGSASVPEIEVTTVLNLSDATHYSASLTKPTVNYSKKPDAIHTPQAVTPASIAALSATANSVLTYTDKTIQPYRTVYMYKRTALADLRPW